MIPCEECLLIPICRHKKYQQFVRECESIYSELYIDKIFDATCREYNFKHLILKVETLMNPTKWRVVLGDRDSIIIREVFYDTM